MVNWIKKYSLTIMIMILLLTIGVGLYLKNPSLHPQLSVMSNSNQKPSETPEPEISTWTSYSNNKYYFAIEIPSKWHVQDYSAFFGDNTALIAFSPNSLPCETCSYLHDGYFSVRIYNQQTSPQLYDIFAQNLKNAGEDNNYQKTELDGKPGVSFGNSVAVENQGWVYELSLDKDEGKAKIADSKIFQRVISSFRFTSIFQ